MIWEKRDLNVAIHVRFTQRKHITADIVKYVIYMDGEETKKVVLNIKAEK